MLTYKDHYNKIKPRGLKLMEQSNLNKNFNGKHTTRINAMRKFDTWAIGHCEIFLGYGDIRKSLKRDKVERDKLKRRYRQMALQRQAFRRKRSPGYRSL